MADLRRNTYRSDEQEWHGPVLFGEEGLTLRMPSSICVAKGFSSSVLELSKKWAGQEEEDEECKEREVCGQENKEGKAGSHL